MRKPSAETAPAAPSTSGPVELLPVEALDALKLKEVNESAVAAAGDDLPPTPDASAAPGFPALSADMAKRRDRNGRAFDPRIHKHDGGVPVLRSDGALMIEKRAGSRSAQVSVVNVSAADGESPSSSAPGADASAAVPAPAPVGLPPEVVGTMYAETAGRMVRVALGDEWKATDVERKAYPELIAAIAAKRGWGRAIEPEWALMGLVAASVVGRVKDTEKNPETAKKVSWLKVRALKTWGWMRGQPYVEVLDVPKAQPAPAPVAPSPAAAVSESVDAAAPVVKQAISLY